MLQVLDQEEKKLFYKEVELLHGLHHGNIVRLKGVSCQPLAMMLEYVCTDCLASVTYPAGMMSQAIGIKATD